MTSLLVHSPPALLVLVPDPMFFPVGPTLQTSPSGIFLSVASVSRFLQGDRDQESDATHGKLFIENSRTVCYELASFFVCLIYLSLTQISIPTPTPFHCSLRHTRAHTAVTYSLSHARALNYAQSK